MRPTLVHSISHDTALFGLTWAFWKRGILVHRAVLCNGLGICHIFRLLPSLVGLNCLQNFREPILFWIVLKHYLGDSFYSAWQAIILLVTILTRLRVLLGMSLSLVAVCKAENRIFLAVISCLLKPAEGGLFFLMSFVMRIEKFVIGLLIRGVINHILLIWLVTDVFESAKGWRHIFVIWGRFPYLFVVWIWRVELLGVLIVIKLILYLRENAIKRGLKVEGNLLIFELFDPHLLIDSDNSYWVTMLILQAEAVLLKRLILFLLLLIHQWKVILALFVLANYFIIGAWIHLVWVVFETGEGLSAVHDVGVVVQTFELILVRVVLENVLDQFSVRHH